MSRLLAFNVATHVAAPAADEQFLAYDTERQQLVWAGDGETGMGAALCTGGRYSGRNPCRSTGTSCTGTYCSKSYLGCYACDYG